MFQEFYRVERAFERGQEPPDHLRRIIERHEIKVSIGAKQKQIAHNAANQENPQTWFEGHFQGLPVGRGQGRPQPFEQDRRVFIIKWGKLRAHTQLFLKYSCLRTGAGKLVRNLRFGFKGLDGGIKLRVAPVQNVRGAAGHHNIGRNPDPV